MSGAVIEFKNITVRKTRRTVLENINLSIFPNEFVGIIGPNGAGKTTLLDVIAGFERFEGTLRLFGRPELCRGGRETRLNIGYIPQITHVDPAFPIRVSEVVMTGLTGRLGLLRPPGRKDKEKLSRLMELMRMTHLADRPFGQLSGGERQKVLLTRALLGRPQVLLMDEPTVSLDIAARKEILRFIGEIRDKSNVTILFVTHDLGILSASMRRAVLMNHGRIVFDGDVETAMSERVLGTVFDYSLKAVHLDGKRFISYD